jgi:hypothetical protein
VRIGQLRSLPRECSLALGMRASGHVFQCYGNANSDWDAATEDTRDFGSYRAPLSSNATASTAFLYNGINGSTGAPLPASAAVSRERALPVSGMRSDRSPAVYAAPAHAVWLDPQDGLAANRKIVEALVASKFVDMHTRAVFVDVTVFNPMLDLTTQVRHVFVLVMLF